MEGDDANFLHLSDLSESILKGFAHSLLFRADLFWDEVHHWMALSGSLSIHKQHDLNEVIWTCLFRQFISCFSPINPE